jgi:hypothetical protein
MAYMRFCKLCGKICHVSSKHSKYCEDCFKLSTEISQTKSKIVRYEQVAMITRAELEKLLDKRKELVLLSQEYKNVKHTTN